MQFLPTSKFCIIFTDFDTSTSLQFSMGCCSFLIALFTQKSSLLCSFFPQLLCMLSSLLLFYTNIKSTFTQGGWGTSSALSWIISICEFPRRYLVNAYRLLFSCYLKTLFLVAHIVSQQTTVNKLKIFTYYLYSFSLHFD